MLKDRRIVLGVTGGIAAYKAAELVRELVRRDTQVRVVMTSHGCEFVTPLTFETLSGQPVATDLFRLTGNFEIGHITLAKFAEIVVIAPATANIIGKIAAGIADDLLTTVVLATSAPVLICPAMNDAMYANAIVQGNLERLIAHGYSVLAPGYGDLACRTEGQGRLPDVPDIVDEVEMILSPKDLQRERVIVTAGPTQEPFDPVRYMTNYSSGKMGYTIAESAVNRGHDVTLVSGPVALKAAVGARMRLVRNAKEMCDAVMEEFPSCDVLIMAAAVADYRPLASAQRKIKKESRDSLTIELTRNPDILTETVGPKVKVGFAAETEDLLAHEARVLRGYLNKEKGK